MEKDAELLLCNVEVKREKGEGRENADANCERFSYAKAEQPT